MGKVITRIKITDQLGKWDVRIRHMDKHTAAHIIANLPCLFHNLVGQLCSRAVIMPDKHLDANQNIRMHSKQFLDFFLVNLLVKKGVPADFPLSL